MTLQVDDIRIPVGDYNPDEQLPGVLAKKLGVDPSDITGIEIDRKSLDARKKSSIYYRYRLLVDSRDDAGIHAKTSQFTSILDRPDMVSPIGGIKISRTFDRRPVIIGSGPSGVFAALVLAQAGRPAIILERGEPVEQRSRTVHRFRRSGEFSPESNYCYGEGGAGTFSDGKLTCGRNHPLIRYIFREWVRFGAPREILFDAHPHIGSDRLVQVTKNMRNYLEDLGTDFLFGQCLTDLQKIDDGVRLVTADGTMIDTDDCILAIGHSARETYQMLLERGVAMGAKPFAMGVRVEHPQEEINRIQYGSCPYLPSAEYKLAAQVGERGIWTFCMCPGGHLLPTSAQPGHLAINGMSYHARNSGFANAALVVNVRREDFDRGHVLDGMRLQEKLEKDAFQLGGGEYFTPAQRVSDFIKGKKSKGTLLSSYKPGVVNARLDHLLPEFISESLKQALSSYDQRMRGFISDQAIVAGVESKTSSPIIMHRGKDKQSISHPGLYPTGEGAGYAGGVVSAALDGVQVAKAVLTRVN